jgi:hypothetical protein
MRARTVATIRSQRSPLNSKTRRQAARASSACRRRSMPRARCRRVLTTLTSRPRHFAVATVLSWNLHQAEELGIDDFQSSRSPASGYRTAPLKGLWTHGKGGFYHDSRFATLAAVVDHYDNVKNLHLSAQEKNDLVEFLKSL